MMNPDIKAQWLTALRSGQYVQGRGMLRQTSADGQVQHCCLGVLCDLYIQAHPDKAHWHPGLQPSTMPGREGSKASYFIAEFDEQRSLLPYHVYSWAGIQGTNIFVHQHNRSISALNDRGTSFAAIADILEHHPEL